MLACHAGCPALLVALIAASFTAGCTNPIDGPRDRHGALPFPGVFTFYRTGDPADLGRHRYERMPRVWQEEVENGIIYTKQAGFLDLAHIRITVDYARYCSNRIRDALIEHEDVVSLRTIDGSRFLVVLKDRLPGMSSSIADDPQLAEELSIRTGQRLAYLMMDWHEVITWFGWRTFPLVDESPSSFTWDDTMSHVVGLRVAGRALRERSADSYDDAVTAALRDELAALGAVSPAQTEQAVGAVQGVWWWREKPLKRQIDTGLFENQVQPWLVRGLGFAPDTEPQTFALPTLKDIGGRDCSGWCAVYIEPDGQVADRMRRLLPNRPRLFDADRDVRNFIAIVQSQMQERYGRDVDRPWTTTAVAATGSRRSANAATGPAGSAHAASGATNAAIKARHESPARPPATASSSEVLPPESSRGSTAWSSGISAGSSAGSAAGSSAPAPPSPAQRLIGSARRSR